MRSEALAVSETGGPMPHIVPLPVTSISSDHACLRSAHLGFFSVLHTKTRHSFSSCHEDNEEGAVDVRSASIRIDTSGSGTALFEPALPRKFITQPL